MVGQLDDLDQAPLLERARDDEARLDETLTEVIVHLVAVPVPLVNDRLAVALTNPCPLGKLDGLSAEPHRPAEIFDLLCMSGVLANQAMNFLASGKSPTRLGNAHPNITPYQTLPVADGRIVVAVGNDAQFRRFTEVIGIAEAGTDPRFATNERRVENRQALTALIEARTIAWRRDDLLAKLEVEGVPAGPINTVADVFADPQFDARKMRIEAGGVPGVRTPISFSEASLDLSRPSPKLDEHGDAIRRTRSFSIQG